MSLVLILTSIIDIWYVLSLSCIDAALLAVFCFWPNVVVDCIEIFYSISAAVLKSCFICCLFVLRVQFHNKYIYF